MSEHEREMVEVDLTQDIRGEDGVLYEAGRRRRVPAALAEAMKAPLRDGAAEREPAELPVRHGAFGSGQTSAQIVGVEDGVGDEGEGEGEESGASESGARKFDARKSGARKSGGRK